MADTEKVLGQLSALDERIKQKKAEVKELENKKMELQSKWLDGLMAKNGMNFTDIAELVNEKKSSHSETTLSEKQEYNNKPEENSSLNSSFQNKHN